MASSLLVARVFAIVCDLMRLRPTVLVLALFASTSAAAADGVLAGPCPANGGAAFAATFADVAAATDQAVADPCAGATPSAADAADAPAPTLDFGIDAGDIRNRFYRNGDVSAHLLATSGDKARFVVAFPAGNEGTAIRFQPSPDKLPTSLTFDGPVEPAHAANGMRGVKTTLEANAPKLVLEGAVLGSIREIRNWTEGDHKKEPWPKATSQSPTPDALDFTHTAPDGKSHAEIVITPLDGAAVVPGPNGHYTIAAPDGRTKVRFSVVSTTDETPLTPVDPLAAGTAGPEKEKEVLAFLSYREKFLAGSWRFQTYFGRDTMLSVAMLMPVLRPPAIEGGLSAVIDRIDKDGRVAHEEDAGEWAVHENMHAKHKPADLRAPHNDYKMVDSDFLLAPVIAEYLLDSPAGCGRAQAFLARRTPTGETYAAALARNLRRVETLATPFANAPSPANMIHLAKGEDAGDWRDSRDGLGHGRTPFSVNAVLVPAALRAAQRLAQSGILGADAGAIGSASAAPELGRLADAWSHSIEYFDVSLSEADAQAAVKAYAAEEKLPDATSAVAAITGPVHFPAVSLDGHGKPIPVMQSDDGFVLMFGRPSPAYLEQVAWRVNAPFPAGLTTPVGMVVANPAFAGNKKLRDLFNANHYHGTVVWSWQQALMAAGLAKQIARSDLPAPTRAALVQAQATLWKAIDAASDQSTSELWGAYADGRYQVVPFGSSKADKSESNAAQLWSTVYLGIPHP